MIRVLTSIIVLLGWLISAPSMASTQVSLQGAQEQWQLLASAPLVVQRHFLLSSPPRLVVDLASLPARQPFFMPAGYQGGMVRNIRFGQFSPQTSRLVIDLAAENPAYQIQAEGNRLLIKLPHQPAASPVYNPPAALTPPPPEQKPLQIAREAQKPIIVIDAGHGGKDVGAIGISKMIEKDVTLRYAAALRDALLRTGRFQVIMTRSDDRYLFLPERVEIARKHKGKLFISLHADSNPTPKAMGLSVYTVSEEASDAETAALAQQENKSDIIGGMDLSKEDKAVADILLDLARRETKNKSSEFADLLIANMDRKVPLLKNPHRFAGFRVLKAPDVPSVLVEIGFLSSPQDEKRLQSLEYRDRVVTSMTQTISDYFAAKN